MSRRLDDLVADLCGTAEHPLAPLLRRWCQESPPFLNFAQAHAAKIRKKVRLASSPDEQGDLRAELAVAVLLVRDRRSAVRYEPPHPAGQRGPDFEVTFKGHTTWRAEVTRLRLPENGEDDAEGAEAARRVARVLHDKIGQCLPGGANLLAVALPSGAARSDLVPAALRLLDSPAPPRLRPEAVRDFLRHRQRLSAVALCAFSPGGEPLTLHLWTNPQAKHPLPAEIVQSLVRAAP